MKHRAPTNDAVAVGDDIEAEIVEALGRLNHRAKRCVGVTHRFADDPMTEWDRRHQQIDNLLSDLGFGDGVEADPKRPEVQDA